MSAVDLLIARTQLLLRSEQPASVEATARFVAEHGLDWNELEACCGGVTVLPVHFDGSGST